MALFNTITNQCPAIICQFVRVPTTLVFFFHCPNVLMEPLPLFLANITKILWEIVKMAKFIVKFDAHPCTKNLKVLEHHIHKVPAVGSFCVVLTLSILILNKIVRHIFSCKYHFIMIKFMFSFYFLFILYNFCSPEVGHIYPNSIYGWDKYVPTVSQV